MLHGSAEFSCSCVTIIRVLVLFATCSVTSGVPYQREFTTNVTGTLNSLLLNNNYDKRIRPDFGGPPLLVEVNMHIKSLGPVSENDETYTMDVYFRQAWHDRRLSFSVPGVEEFSMSWLFLDKIWKPDTYFLNGKRSYLHKITSPNKFVRIKQDGNLTYSMRLTVSARCKMHLRKFPLDSQKCPLYIGSYGYTSHDLVYSWTSKGVTLEPGVEMAQYDVVNITIKGDLFAYRGKDEYSIVEANFHMRRSTGYYLLQIYVPCSLIVCCSWISFWITPSDVAGRTSLAVTTVLSITTLGFGGRAQLPKVSHATALDWFVIICFAFAFAVMIEFAVINFTDKLAADIKKLLEERAAKKAAEKVEQEENFGSLVLGDEPFEDIDADSNFPDNKRPYVFLPNRWYSVPTDLSAQPFREEVLYTAVTPSSQVASSRAGSRLAHTLMAPFRYLRGFTFIPRHLDPLAERRFHQIDIVARRAFPVAFISMMTTYSLLYTYYITDRLDEELDEEMMI
ncbi:gamma-aminobutyric acid receptor subunit alpha-6-like [Rhodnius prolixus]|uniref:gamma-aminobutyric acid receptor subunit alpha-6-like n=1 Tax=Rhodnius prolixus TaxID=13249 RepID=UPI003D18A343